MATWDMLTEMAKDINKFDQSEIREFLVYIGMERSTDVNALKKTAKDFICVCHSDTLV